MVAAAVIGGAVISAGAGMASSSMAAGAQQAAAQTAANTQMAMFDTTQANLQPYMNFGNQALGPLSGLLGLTGGQGGAPNSAGIQNALNSMPGYQFALNTGLNSVQNGMAARGLGSSGAAMRGAADYATGLAQSNYGNYVNMLQNAAGLGQNSAAMVGQGAIQTGANVGNSLIAGGNAAAAGYLGMGNAINNSINGVSSYYGGMNMLAQLQNGGGSAYAGTETAI